MSNTGPLIRTDVSGYTFAPNDYIIIYDDVKEQKHMLLVDKLQEETPEKRIYAVTVIESTSPMMPPGTKISAFEISKITPVTASVIRHSETKKRFDQYELNRVAEVEIIKWLDSRSEEGNKALFKSCIKFLIMHGIFDPEQPNLKGRYSNKTNERFRKICEGSDHLVSKGGWVFAVHGAAKKRAPGEINPSYGHSVIEVDFRKLCAGIHLVLSSFSCFRIKNNE